MDLTQTSTSTVLGKRSIDAVDRNNLVLHLTSSSEAENSAESSHSDDFQSDSESDTPPRAQNSIASSSRSFQRYLCTSVGCGKSYTKPARLVEHIRSHTGERPFTCSSCEKAFLRESHLQAHARVHLPESQKPLVCPETECGKRFWTTQHLRVHQEWHKGAKKYLCSEAGCTHAFVKHNQLRAHICEKHSPPGTKPFPCTEDGCSRSFDTNQHLKTHLKVHQDNRYTCVRPTCLPSPHDDKPTYFSTWTALQHHIRTVHPPQCHHRSCDGRTFASQKGLRAHQKLHEQRDAEEDLDNNQAEITDDEGPFSRPAKRRRGGEMGRDWICAVDGCGKDFKSKKALTVHSNVTHLGKRDFACGLDGCNQTFGYRHLLQRHTTKVHDAPKLDGSTSTTREVLVDAEAVYDVGTITGSSYIQDGLAKLSTGRMVQCPHPSLDELGVTTEIGSENPKPKCAFLFSRAYDVRRHLKASHGVEVDKVRVDEWVQKRKQELSRGEVIL